MANQKCLDNIAKKTPPYNIPCTQSFCQKIRSSTNTFCQEHSFPPNTPILTYDPAIGTSCYCCCGDVSTNIGMPIATTEKEFVLSQDIQKMDTVLTTGLELNWRPGKVATVSMAIDASMVPGLFLLRYQMESTNTARELYLPMDHLVMLASDRSLRKVQSLKVGDDLLAADGRIAKVAFVEFGIFKMSIYNIEMEGEFYGENLDGHLLNTNGIVSADFKVQAYYALNEK